VAAPHAVALLRREADAVIVLAAPPGFYAVGQFYQDFRQVEDDEVRALLAEERDAV
jgi:putative phosphoribosyl transferase